jgi:hypothetical protein
MTSVDDGDTEDQQTLLETVVMCTLKRLLAFQDCQQLKLVVESNIAGEYDDPRLPAPCSYNHGHT